MHPTRQAAAIDPEPIRPVADEPEPLELTSADIMVEPTFGADRWEDSQSEERGSGGRQLLGWTLALLAAAWLGYTAWSAGRALAGQPLTSPAIAQWVGRAAAPLAL